MRRHLSFANVASLLALLFSMSGGAIAAHHYLINSTGQINPKVLKKLRGAVGEIGPIGPQGPTGEAGPKGSNGGRGEPAPSVLTSGASESGDFGIRGTVKEGTLAQTLTFRIPLAAPITNFVVTSAEVPVAGCAGPGQATKGTLCIYTTVATNAVTPLVFTSEAGGPKVGTGRLGFGLEVKVTGEAPAYEGTYTVTGS